MSNAEILQRSLHARLDEEVQLHNERAMGLMKQVEERGLELSLSHHSSLSSVPLTSAGIGWDYYYAEDYYWEVTSKTSEGKIVGTWSTLTGALEYIQRTLKGG